MFKYDKINKAIAKQMSEIIRQAREYAENYGKQYNITDPALLSVIYWDHLIYLANEKASGR